MSRPSATANTPSALTKFVLGYLTLVALFLLLFFLCFVFGIHEWLWPQDAAPLAIDPDDVRVENFLGVSFRAKIRELLKTALPVPQVGARGESLLAVLANPEGGKILVMAKDSFMSASEVGESIFCEGDLQLAPGAVFGGEIYAVGSVRSGAGAKLVALASDGKVLLGADTQVEQWVDSQGAIVLGPGTVTGGRISSLVSIGLEPGVSAESLYAPLILTAEYSDDEVDANTAAKVNAHAPVTAGPRLPDTAGGLTAISGSVALSPETEMVQGDVELPDGARVLANLVVQGTLRSGGSVQFGGSIKANRVEMGPRNRVDGSIVSKSTLRIGQGSRVTGNLMAESDILLDRGARIGAEGRESAVTAARDVVLETNVAVRGKISAGRTIVTV